MPQNQENLEIIDSVQRRIAQDLHDGLSQHLTGIALLSKSLEKKLSEKSLPEAGQAKQIRELVNQLITQTHEVISGLYPIELEGDDLSWAFKKLCSHIESIFGISCELVCDQSLKIEDRSTRLHLFRIAQEAINNAIKHSKAKSLRVELMHKDHHVTLIVKDDGKGMPEIMVKKKGLGLQIMNHRAQMIHATLNICCDDEEGTTITCVFPYSKEKQGLI